MIWFGLSYRGLARRLVKIPWNYLRTAIRLLRNLFLRTYLKEDAVLLNPVNLRGAHFYRAKSI
jgi:hypothetical protein